MESSGITEISRLGTHNFALKFSLTGQKKLAHLGHMVFCILPEVSVFSGCFNGQ